MYALEEREGKEEAVAGEGEQILSHAAALTSVNKECFNCLRQMTV